MHFGAQLNMGQVYLKEIERTGKTVTTVTDAELMASI